MAIDTSLTLTDLLNPPGLNVLLSTIKSRLGLAGFSPTDWETDSDGRIILQVEASTLADLWQAVLLLAKEGYLDTATGDWLDLLAQSQYQLTRKPAIQTIGTITLSTVSGAGPYTFNAGDLVLSTTVGSTTVFFRSTNAAPVTVNAGPSTTTIQVSADVPSSNGNVATGTIFTVVTPRPGLVITNPGTIQPALIQTGITNGPYPLGARTLKISVSINGSGIFTDTLTFPAAITTLTAVSTEINNLIAASTGLLAGRVTTSVVASTLVFQTIPPGSATIVDTLTIDNTSTATQLLGLKAATTYSVVGSFAWITQYGQDPESDKDLIARCKAEWGIIGTGTRDAFISWATSADPQTARVIVYSNYYDGTPKSGAVTLYIAPTTGVFIPVQAPAHVALVYNYINPKMPIMSQLFVGPALGQDIVITGDLYIKANYDQTMVNNAAQNAANAYVLSLGIGETFIKDKLIAAIVDVEGVSDIKNLAPGNDVVPAKNIIFTNNTTNVFRNFSV